MRIAAELGELAARVAPGPPEVAILWHSMFTDSRSWDPVLDKLRGKRTLVLVDGWSFGASADLDRVVRKFTDCCVQGAVAVFLRFRRSWPQVPSTGWAAPGVAMWDCIWLPPDRSWCAA